MEDVDVEILGQLPLPHLTLLFQGTSLPNAENSQQFSWDRILSASTNQAEFLVLAHRRTVLVFEWRLASQSSDPFKLLCRISGCQSETEVISALSVVTLSASAKMDSVRILCGYNSGYVRVFTARGELLQSRLFHAAPLIAIHARDDIHSQFHTEVQHGQLQRDGLVELVFTEGVLIQLSISGLCLHQHQHPPLYQKYRVKCEDCVDIQCLGKPPQDSTLFSMQTSSFHSAFPVSQRCEQRWLAIGQQPMLSMYTQTASDRTPLLSVNQLTTMVASSVFSFAKSFLSTGGGPSGGHAPSMQPPAQQVQQPPTALPPFLSMNDPHRFIRSMSVSPCRKLVALGDNLGRAFVLDAQEGTMIRMWKGWRDVQFIWIPLSIPKNEDHGQRKRFTGKQILMLGIYSERRGLFEIYWMRRGRRVACIKSIGSGARILDVEGFEALVQPPSDIFKFHVLSKEAKILCVTVCIDRILITDKNQLHIHKELQDVKSNIETYAKSDPARLNAFFCQQDVPLKSKMSVLQSLSKVDIDVSQCIVFNQALIDFLNCLDSTDIWDNLRLDESSDTAIRNRLFINRHLLQHYQKLLCWNDTKNNETQIDANVRVMSDFSMMPDLNLESPQPARLSAKTMEPVTASKVVASGNDDMEKYLNAFNEVFQPIKDQLVKSDTVRPLAFPSIEHIDLNMFMNQVFDISIPTNTRTAFLKLATDDEFTPRIARFVFSTLLSPLDTIIRLDDALNFVKNFYLDGFGWTRLFIDWYSGIEMNPQSFSSPVIFKLMKSYGMIIQLQKNESVNEEAILKPFEEYCSTTESTGDSLILACIVYSFLRRDAYFAKPTRHRWKKLLAETVVVFDACCASRTRLSVNSFESKEDFSAHQLIGLRLSELNPLKIDMEFPQNMDYDSTLQMFLKKYHSRLDNSLILYYSIPAEIVFTSDFSCVPSIHFANRIFSLVFSARKPMKSFYAAFACHWFHLNFGDRIRSLILTTDKLRKFPREKFILKAFQISEESNNKSNESIDDEPRDAEPFRKSVLELLSALDQFIANVLNETNLTQSLNGIDLTLPLKEILEFHSKWINQPQADASWLNRSKNLIESGRVFISRKNLRDYQIAIKAILAMGAFELRLVRLVKLFDDPHFGEPILREEHPTQEDLTLENPSEKERLLFIQKILDPSCFVTIPARTEIKKRFDCIQELCDAFGHSFAAEEPVIERVLLLQYFSLALTSSAAGSMKVPEIELWTDDIINSRIQNRAHLGSRLLHDLGHPFTKRALLSQQRCDAGKRWISVLDVSVYNFYDKNVGFSASNKLYANAGCDSESEKWETVQTRLLKFYKRLQNLGCDTMEDRHRVDAMVNSLRC